LGKLQDGQSIDSHSKDFNQTYNLIRKISLAIKKPKIAR